MPIKNTYFILLLLLAFSVKPLAAQEGQDPLAGQRAVVKSAELVLMYADPGPKEIHRSLFDYVSFGNPDLGDSLQTQDRQTLSGSQGYGGSANDVILDAVVGNFDGEGTDEMIQVWEGTNLSIMISFPTTTLEPNGNAPRLLWGEHQTYMLKPEGTLLGETLANRMLRVIKGQFDDDPLPELLLGYLDNSGSLQVELFEVDGSLLVSMYAGSLFELPVSDGSTTGESTIFDLGASDLDDDGRDELVVGYGDNLTDGCTASSQGCWQAIVKAYDMQSGSPSEIGSVSFYKKTDNSNLWLERIAVTSGDLDGDGREEIAAGIHVPHNGSQHRWFIEGVQLNEAGTALEGTGTANVQEQVHQTTGSYGFPLSLETFDFDRDGLDEVVYHGRTLIIFESDSLFSGFSSRGGYSSGVDDSNSDRRQMVLADVDGASGMWTANTDESIYLPEIVLLEQLTFSENGGIGVDGIRELTVLKYVPGVFNIQEVATKRIERTDGSGYTAMALMAGDFGDRGIRLGKPTYHRRTDVLQPLVILNAPPIHFDMFDGTSYDVAGCYEANGCDFSVFYQEFEERFAEVTSEVSGDWSLGAGLEGGLNEVLNEIPVAGELVVDLLDALGLGIDFSFEASYGEGFSDLVGSSRRLSITSRVETFQEDAIFANVIDYNIWEYPLYVRGSFVGYLSIVLPGEQEDRWFTESAPEATFYRPNHEPGNILSYPSSFDPTRLTREVFRGSQYTLGTQVSSWDITREQTSFSESTESTSLQLGGDLDISLPIPTLELNLNGDYSESTLNTHSTSVTNLQGVEVNFGAINTVLEGKRSNYTVTPFIYWDRSGALVVDYAVEPSIAGVGEVDTWWQDRYGQFPDLALTLPDRYTDIKNGITVDEGIKTRSKSMVVFPTQVIPGEEVTVRAEIHNYSLLPMPSDVPVRFYLGDPNAGGTALTGGSVADPRIPSLAPRSSAEVSLTFAIPSGLTANSARIYAQVDPNNTVEEIHENNNLGWVPVILGLGTDVEPSENPEIATESVLHQSYPNPFSSMTTLSFDLAAPGEARLAVFDVLGREVQVLLDGMYAAGRHQAFFDGAGLGAGMYFYRLETEAGVQTRSMVLAR